MSSKTQNEKQEREKTPHQQAQAFMKAAQEFEGSRIKAIEKSRTLAWRVAVGAGAISVMAVAAVMIMAPLKTVEPFLVRVDNNTGATDIVTALTDAPTKYDEVMNKYWVAQYVKYRESYDWEAIQTTYDATNLLSSPAVQTEFRALYDRPDAPHKILKDKYKVLVTDCFVTFLGDLAQVRYKKTLMPIGRTDEKPIVTQWISTIAFKFENAPRKDTERLVNPLGYQTTSYRADQDTAVK